MSSDVVPITSAAEDGWSQPEACGRTAVGSTFLLPFTDQGYSPLPWASHLRPDSKSKSFPSPHKVLRFPAEAQLKQLIF